MRETLAKAATENEEARKRIALTQVDLVDRINATAADVRDEIAQLRTSKGGRNASLVFAGVRALVAVERLLGELVGQLQPPTTSVYLQKIDVLLATPADATRFSPELRAALAEVQGDGSTP